MRRYPQEGVDALPGEADALPAVQLRLEPGSGPLVVPRALVDRVEEQVGVEVSTSSTLSAARCGQVPEDRESGRR
jgi:hypothetical protein